MLSETSLCSVLSHHSTISTKWCLGMNLHGQVIIPWTYLGGQNYVRVINCYVILTTVWCLCYREMVYLILVDLTNNDTHATEMPILHIQCCSSIVFIWELHSSWVTYCTQSPLTNSRVVKKSNFDVHYVVDIIHLVLLQPCSSWIQSVLHTGVITVSIQFCNLFQEYVSGPKNTRLYKFV
jgi:hypothetical protein